MTRGEILEAWSRRRPLRGRTATGGTADFLVIDSSLRFPVPQAALLPVSDANGVLLELARELPAGVPVLAGVCATDPGRLMDRFLEELRSLGFAGVINSPSVGWVDGERRRSFEETGLGYAREADLIRRARGMDFVCAGLAFTPDEGALMARAGADLVVSPPGSLASVARSAREARPDVRVLSYGPEPLEDGLLEPAGSGSGGAKPPTPREKRS